MTLWLPVSHFNEPSPARAIYLAKQEKKWDNVFEEYEAERNGWLPNEKHEIKPIFSINANDTVYLGGLFTREVAVLVVGGLLYMLKRPDPKDLEEPDPKD